METRAAAPMMIAKRAFTASARGYESEPIAEGERLDATHPIVKAHPEMFRAREVAEELAIRSARIAELNDPARGLATSEPLSAAGRQQRDEDAFWRSVDTMLHRPERVDPEQAIYDRGLELIETHARTVVDDETERWASEYRWTESTEAWHRRSA